MAYLQFSLLHIRSLVVHGTTIAMEEHSAWLTPPHIMGGWWWRLMEKPEELKTGSEARSARCRARTRYTRSTATSGEQLSLF
jgi:hypothetical protein